MNWWWWRCDCDTPDTAGGRALYLLRVTNPTLWLVKTDHVTWILASDWLEMASVPRPPGAVSWQDLMASWRPPPLLWSWDCDDFNAGSNYGSDTFIGKIESNNREHRRMRQMIFFGWQSYYFKWQVLDQIARQNPKFWNIGTKKVDVSHPCIAVGNLTRTRKGFKHCKTSACQVMGDNHTFADFCFYDARVRHWSGLGRWVCVSV